MGNIFGSCLKDDETEIKNLNSKNKDINRKLGLKVSGLRNVIISDKRKISNLQQENRRLTELVKWYYAMVLCLVIYGVYEIGHYLLFYWIQLGEPFYSETLQTQIT